MLRKLRYSLRLAAVLVILFIFAFSRRLSLINFSKRPHSDCYETWRYDKFNESGHLDKVSAWKQLDDQTYVFSAYLDNRDPCSTFITVFGFGMETESPLYGTLVLQHGAKVGLTSKAERTQLNLFGKYNDKQLGPYSYTWLVPYGEGILKELKFILVEQASVSGTKTAVILVTFPTYSGKLFGVCIDSPLFGEIKPSTIIENIEVNKILGAERFTIYVHNIVDDVITELLQEYVREGIAEVVQDWGVHIPKLVHYYGQTLSINECAYRNMFQVKYLVFTDLDEFIVPRKSLSWSEMMDDLENPNYGSYVFKHVFFQSKVVEKNIKSPIELTCNAKTMNSSWPKFLYHTYRSAKTYPSRTRSKYIIKPLFTKILGVHEVFQHSNDFLYSFVVPTSTARLHHYRSFDSIPEYLQNELSKTNLLLDESALLFITNLYVFKKRLCRNFHKFKQLMK